MGQAQEIAEVVDTIQEQQTDDDITQEMAQRCQNQFMHQYENDDTDANTVEIHKVLTFPADWLRHQPE